MTNLLRALFGIFILFCSPAMAGPDLQVSTPTAATSLVLSTTPGTIIDGYCASGTAGWCMAFDATAAPADGAVTPYAVAAVPTAGTGGFDWAGRPAEFRTGMVLVFSSTGPFTKTAATAYISGRVVK